MLEPRLAGAVFAFGNVYVTLGVMTMLALSEIAQALERHVAGDWGDASAENKASNDAALANGGRLLSVYHDPSGVKFWIITETDRNATTVLLPDDY